MADSIQVETEEEFYARVKPALEQIEQLRCEEKLLLKHRLRKLWVIFPLVAAVMHHYDAYPDIVVLSGGGSVLAFSLVWALRPLRDYAEDYKGRTMPKIAALLGLWYLPEGFIPRDELEQSGIVPEYEIYHPHDYFEGTYKNAKLRFAQLKLTRDTENHGNTPFVFTTVFDGLCILIDLPEVKFEGMTIMMKSSLAPVEWVREAVTGLEKADLVDPAFQKQYSVFTTDQVEARFLIDPVVIDRIAHLAHDFGVEGISLSWFNANILILIPGGPRFFTLPDISSSALDAEFVLGVRQQIGNVVALIDYLDVYQTRK